MVAIQDSINNRFCSVVEIKLSFFLKGGHLPRSGSSVVYCHVFSIYPRCYICF